MRKLFCLTCIVLVCTPLLGRTITVGADKDHSTVSSAIAASQPHDSILVYPGLYKEHTLIIEHALTFIGIDRPVIDAEKQMNEIFVVLAHGVHISGFVLQNVGVSFLKELSAVKVKRGRGSCTNNIIKDCFFGIYLEQVTDYEVRDNVVQGTIENEANAGNAIHVWKGSKINISGNKLTGHRDGIYLEFVDESEITHNISKNNIRYGLHFMFSNDDAYISNEFSQNGAGVAVMFSKRIKMKHNAFTKNWGGASYGLLLKEISDGELSDNNFTKNTIGILAEGANRLQIKHNEFTLNGTALDMKGNSLDCVIDSNNFIANTFEVITNTKYNNNLYSHNYWSHYSGYDLNRDGICDEPYRPVSIYAAITKKIPAATVMLHSLIIDLLDLTERIMPNIIPAELIDNQPMMKPYSHDPDQ